MNRQLKICLLHTDFLLTKAVFPADNQTMRTLFSVSLLVLLTSCLIPAQAPTVVSQQPSTQIEKIDPVPVQSMIAGTETGIYRLTGSTPAIPLWTGGKVSRIIRTEQTSDDGTISDRWFFVTSQGILTSTDLVTFEYRNSGLPFLTIKQYDGVITTFVQQPAQLKDLSVHPQNSKILVTATKDTVYITYDAGLSWQSLGSMSGGTAGIKAVAVATMNRPGTGKAAVKNKDGTINPAVAPQTDLVVFMSHPIFGFSYICPELQNRSWADVSAGFETLPTQTYPDEISDILPVVRTGAEGFPETELYISQSFMPRIYRFDWKKKRAEKIYAGSEPADTIDGMTWNGSNLVYTRPGTVETFNPDTGNVESVPAAYAAWKNSFSSLVDRGDLNSVWLPSDDKLGLTLSELWLLNPGLCTGTYAEKALGRKSVYVPVNHVMTQTGINTFKSMIAKNGLDSLVIDMKDDYGLLRYDSKDPVVMQKGFISRYSVQLDHFVSEFKKDHIYLIARIVVFKDKNLASYDGGKYAVWDKTTGKPWIGTKGFVDVTDPVSGAITGKQMQYYDEHWVDPYSPDVWEYNIAIARELISRGFDEIQFDYIRFPTDGQNMNQATFRWKSAGMDKESALISFLSYARKNIHAPIGIDIYGANGWYRSGARTGQDVELLSQYVDVISPMFYPSHFEQTFLNFAPYSERPYRVYFYGTYRASVIGRNRVVIRPWVQAFYLNVSYDRQFYDKTYVQKEIFGVRDSVNRGYMYWNNAGRYDDICPDVGSAAYTGSAPEADARFRKPALSSAAEQLPGFVPLPVTDLNMENSRSDTLSLKNIQQLWQAYSTSGS
jgi:hypothetical protein